MYLVDSKLMNKIIIIILSAICFTQAQKYDVTIWGIPVGTAKIQQDTDGEITFNLKSYLTRNSFLDTVNVDNK